MKSTHLQSNNVAHLLSYSVGNGSFESSHKKPKHSAARVPSSAAFRLASAPGKASNATIHCEAFVLSNQTLSLLDSNLLSWQRRSFAPTSTGAAELIPTTYINTNTMVILW